MKLTSHERETIIIFNEADNSASINTYNKALRRQMSNIASKNPKVISVFETEEYSEYICPKKWIKIRKPPELSAFERSERAKRLKAFKAKPEN